MAKKTTSKKTKSISKKTSDAKPVTIRRKKAKFSWDVRTWNFAPLATLGPIGFFPKGPGTMGSLVALPFAYVLNHISIPLLWAVVFLIFGIGLVAIQQYTQDKDEKDPSCVIIDEVVGQMIPFMIIIPDFMHWPMVFLAFALFRFFDIFKFGAVAFWDRRKNPMGVMMDDVSAGQFAKGVINFGVNDAAGAMFSGAGASIIKGGASLASAGWHAAAPNSDDLANSTRQNTRLGSFARGAMTMGALGPLGVAAATRRFQKTPAYTGNGTKDTLRTSRLGTAVGRVRSWFGGANPTFAKRREKDGVFRLDGKTGIHTRTAKDGSVSRYDTHKNTYTKTDRSGKEVSSYNFATGDIKLNGQDYKIDRTGAVLDASGAAVSDAAIAASVRGVQAEAEAGKARMEQLLRERNVQTI